MQPNSCNIRKIKNDMSHPPKSNSRDELPPELLSILGSSLKVGGVTGVLPYISETFTMSARTSKGVVSAQQTFTDVGLSEGICGIFVGAIGGVLRSATPKLFAVASGIQWFALGSTFWGMFKASKCVSGLSLICYSRSRDSGLPESSREKDASRYAVRKCRCWRSQWLGWRTSKYVPRPRTTQSTAIDCL